jgi:hypothetical protein
MPEIKHTFTAGRMNKDLDERLVPNGEYRDALNIQVRTSDGGEAGTVQNILGNSLTTAAGQLANELSENAKAVGSVVDEKNDAVYFLIASPNPVIDGSTTISTTKIYKDIIVEQRSNGAVVPVAVDIHTITETYALASSPDPATPFTQMTVVMDAPYRVGMEVLALDYNTSPSTNLLAPGTKVKDIDGTTVTLDREQSTDLSNADVFVWRAEKALGFDPDTLITGINVIEDFMFWTDDRTEPKKINIARCKDGTPDFDTHTKLKLEQNNGSYVEASEYESGNPSDLLEEHITVIRKAPLAAPTLIMSTSDRVGNTNWVLNFTAGSGSDSYITPASGDFSTVVVGDDMVFNLGDPSIDFRVGDVLTLTCTSPIDVNNVPVLKVKIHEKNALIITCTVLSISAGIGADESEWRAELQQDAPMFELKFPRFGYRYKYEDNEYSTFSPWSEIAFLPSTYDFEPKKGYNLGMVNGLRDLKIKDFLVDTSIRPDDIKSIDILMKSTDSPTVYVVKSINRETDPEWNQLIGVGGQVVVESEMIHKAVASNQILRAWDNVPRYAKAQELTGNRLLFANYVQGYDMPITVGVSQSLISKPVQELLEPEKSAKSLRTYKFGVVFGDKYGRETPVMAAGSRYVPAIKGGLEEISSDVYVSKDVAHNVNTFKLQQSWTTPETSFVPPEWIDYARYYVKETSSEYYNLIMNQWYDASDGNVWISFQSADRNKIDEDSYLILKSENGSNALVEEEGRYKVLAISNEAPEFVKTDRRIMGRIKVDDIDATENASHEPVNLMVGTEFDISTYDWNNFLGNNNFSGTPKVRLIGTEGGNEVRTEWVTITRLTAPVSGGTVGSISIQRSFGDGANMPSFFVANGYIADLATAAGAITYHFEIMDAVPENKPEFDGRFFVKIARDVTLENKVLVPSSADVEYTVKSTYYTAYIDAHNATHQSTGQETYPAPQAAYASALFGQFTPSEINSDKFGTCDKRSETKNFWTEWAEEIATAGTATMFIDEAQAAFRGTVDGFTMNHITQGYGGLSFTPAAKSGTLDRLMFGTRETGWGVNAGFRTKMSSIGTMFRFRLDPNQIVYRVTSSGGWSNGVANYHKNNFLGISNCNLPCDQDEAACVRSMFHFTFKRINQTTNTLTNEGVNTADWDPRGELKHDGRGEMAIDIVERVLSEEVETTVSNLAGVFETEPKENIELDIYYEASASIPVRLKESTIALFAPYDSALDSIVRSYIPVAVNASGVRVRATEGENVIRLMVTAQAETNYTSLLRGDKITLQQPGGLKVTAVVEDHVALSNTVVTTPSVSYSTSSVTDDSNTLDVSSSSGISVGDLIYGSNVTPGTTVTNIASNTLTISANPTDDGTGEVWEFVTPTEYYSLVADVWEQPVEVPWHNCYTFGNGVESNRIRDDFNAKTIDNGVAVSTTLLDYGEERRQAGLIYSGIYNSGSGVNELNEFNLAEKITKDINPSYGSIQALKTRDSDVVTFTEDKVLKILANKDALYNADGNVNLTATDRVLGQAVPFVGDYGISRNPESLQQDEFRMYFTDRARGAVLRLSRDGITPISNVGMKDWFRDNIMDSKNLVGTYDNINGEYNLSIRQWPGSALASTTATFNEGGKGWVSFKSFVADAGGTVGGTYFTANDDARIWKHYDATVNRNSFYGAATANSTVSVLLNDMPGSVKGFKTLNYEGTQAKVDAFTQVSPVDAAGNTLSNITDGEFYNLTAKTGWHATSVTTNLETGEVDEFINKEGKWFNKITGEATTLANLDPSEFSVQGIGLVAAVTANGSFAQEYTLTIQDLD